MNQVRRPDDNLPQIDPEVEKELIEKSDLSEKEKKKRIRKLNIERIKRIFSGPPKTY